MLVELSIAVLLSVCDLGLVSNYPITQSGSLFRRQLEINHIAPEASGADCPEKNGSRHPDRADNHGRLAEGHPQAQTDQEAENRWQQIADFLFLRAHVVTQQGGQVDAHKRD